MTLSTNKDHNYNMKKSRIVTANYDTLHQYDTRANVAPKGDIERNILFDLDCTSLCPIQI